MAIQNNNVQMADNGNSAGKLSATKTSKAVPLSTVKAAGEATKNAMANGTVPNVYKRTKTSKQASLKPAKTTSPKNASIK